ncbi:MAG TPA: dihydrolipoamide acetyltransferase family protein [Gaiellaceae bacterium]|nr:dihydrolipoamide acetyltransferase family protein [Gaiellaceae bacterium]
MAAELIMPKLSDSEADAVIVKWLKSPGEAFRRGEGLIEVETDKATVVYDAEADGTLETILVAEGEAAAVGQPIAVLGGASGKRPAATNGAPPRVEARPNASPVARRTALELGLSLHGIAGTGPGGRITREDVERAAGDGAAAAPAPQAADGRGEVSVVALTPTQATIARRMSLSATTIPVFTVSIDANVSQIVALRQTVENPPSLNDFIVKAAALTLREFPRFNASWVDGAVHCFSRVNVGIAVATDDALLVPVVFDADAKKLPEISAETRRLAAAARDRSIRPEELRDGTFTVSNLGMFGVRSFTAIVDPPQVAILAVGGAIDDAMTLTLSCDHRVVYGADGARFLSRLRELLEQPLVLAV